jgi:hypothetical protein
MTENSAIRNKNGAVRNVIQPQRIAPTPRQKKKILNMRMSVS